MLPTFVLSQQRSAGKINGRTPTSPPTGRRFESSRATLSAAAITRSLHNLHQLPWLTTHELTNVNTGRSAIRQLTTFSTAGGQIEVRPGGFSVCQVADPANGLERLAHALGAHSGPKGGEQVDVDAEIAVE